MDQIKIGKLISERRKLKMLTQAQLAEILNITDRAVSKWETGKSMPDASIMLELCNILEISVNDLLNGEVVTMNNYDSKQEQILLDFVKQKEIADKKLLSYEIIIGFLSIFIILSLSIIAKVLEMPNALRVILVVTGLVIGIIGIVFAIRIEQIAGYYQCAKCKEKYVPKYLNVLFSMHFGRTRLMKCPNCKKRSWQKKVIKK